MSISYANFTDSSVNYGNYIIDYATKNFIKSFTNDRIVEFDSFGRELPKGNHSLLFIPGCTLITKGQSGILDKIDKLEYPSFCLAGSLWYPHPEPSYLLRSRLIKIKSYIPDLSIVNKIDGIIGSRDKFTFNVLKRNGLNTLYTGCPTLFLPKENISDEEYVLMSFGRHKIREQVHYALKVAKKNNVIGITHEKGHYEKILAAGWKLPLIEFMGDIELYLSYFKKATTIITGRLHGALPGLAYGKTVLYFGTKDSRTTILDDLGIRIYRIKDIPQFISLAQKIANPVILDYFHKNLTEVARSIFSFRENNDSDR